MVHGFANEDLKIKLNTFVDAATYEACGKKRKLSAEIRDEDENKKRMKVSSVLLHNMHKSLFMVEIA